MDNNENNINNENLVEENTSAKETNGVDENGGYVSQFGELTNADGEPLETTAPTEEPKKSSSYLSTFTQVSLLQFVYS